MSILGLYSHLWWDAPESDEDDNPAPAPEPAEQLYIHDGAVCWSMYEYVDD